MYPCLGCSERRDPRDLFLCGASHLGIDDLPHTVGPLCSDCLIAHNLTTHDAEPMEWVN